MKQLRTLLILIILLAIPVSGFAQDKDKSTSDFECSIPKKFRKVRPHPDGTPTEVKLGIIFVDIKAIKDVSQTFSSDIIARASWNDHRLSKKSIGKSLEHCDFTLDQIWHPDLIPVNVVQVDIYKKMLDIDENGNVNYSMRIRNGGFYSDFLFKDFPFDRQDLHLMLITFEQEDDELTFSIDNEYTGIRKTLSAEGWDIILEEPIISTEYLEVQDRYLTRIDFRLSAERHTGYYLWKVILPLCFIVLMAWCVFWINPSEVGPQIGLSTASVFTLIAYRFSLGFLLPPVTYFTRMDIFILLSTILVFSALGVGIATSRLASKGKLDLALKIERYSKVLYLILFAVIIMVSFFL